MRAPFGFYQHVTICFFTLLIVMTTYVMYCDAVARRHA